MASRPVVTPSILQMEATECGAACLGIVLAFYGKHVPLEELREECGVSRDGSKLSNVLKAGATYGLECRGWSKPVDGLRDLRMPAIIHWNFNHFVVLEGFRKGRVHLNDPASGRRTVSEKEFDEAFTGVVLTAEPTERFAPGGSKPSVLQGLIRRIRSARTAIAFLTLTSLALVIPGLALPTLTRAFVDDILIQGKDTWLKPLLWGLVLTAIARGVLTWLKQRYLLRTYTKLAVAHSSQFLWHTLQLPVSFFLARLPGDVQSRVDLNDRLAGILSGRLGLSALDLIMIVFFGALLLSYDVTLTLVGVAVSSVNIIMLRYLSRRRSEQNQRLQQERGKLIGVAMGGLQLIETLKAAGAESDFFSKWAGYWAKVQNAAQELEVATMILSAMPVLLTAVNSAAILTLGGLRVIDGTMSVGMLVAYQSLMASFMQPVNSLVELGGVIQEAEADVKRLDDVLSHRTITSPIPDAQTIVVSRRKLSGRVELSGLTFGYARHNPPLIREFSLTVEPGMRIALVGGSGSGKSTVSKLIAGLYAPWEGEIRFDGRPRAAISQELLAHSLAMVDQDISLFEGSVRENITLWDSNIPEERIIQAAKDAHIHDEIATRSGGYEAQVEEGGRNFSGGQRQRLEIARALARDPTILILDEATSALDPKTEEIIDQNLRRRGVTCLIVAHRLSTIRDADEILILDQGVVVERGTHDHLMEANGTYARLMGSA